MNRRDFLAGLVAAPVVAAAVPVAEWRIEGSDDEAVLCLSRQLPCAFCGTPCDVCSHGPGLYQYPFVLRKKPHDVLACQACAAAEMERMVFTECRFLTPEEAETLKHEGFVRWMGAVNTALIENPPQYPQKALKT